MDFKLGLPCCSLQKNNSKLKITYAEMIPGENARQRKQLLRTTVNIT